MKNKDKILHCFAIIMNCKLSHISVLFLLTLPIVESDGLSDSFFLFPRLPIGAIDSDNALCRIDSRLLDVHLRNHSLWAYKMYDSNAKSVSGILHGTAFHLGHWDECLSTNGPFHTQYCLVNLIANVPEPNPTRDPYSLHYEPMESVFRRIYKNEDQSQQSRNVVRLGWCIPASCTKDDLDVALDVHLDNLTYPITTSLNVTYKATVWTPTCQRDDEFPLELRWHDVLFCTLVIILVILVGVGTFCDVRDLSNLPQHDKSEKKTKSSLGKRILIGFSARKNFNDLSKADDTNPALNILYGLRTIAIFMIIMDHRFGTFLTNPMLNYDFIEKEYRSTASWFIFHGDLFVDTFFILSGILVTYGLMSQFDKKFIHPGFIVLLRYIRLTPLFAFSMFYIASIYVHTGNGPLWKIAIYPEAIYCQKNWWLNLIYLSNYINTDEMCMVHSWYLPCDFHYFIIGIFVVLLIKKNKRMGLALLLALFVTSMAIPFILTVAYRRPALLHFFPKFLLAPRQHEDFQLTYIRSHTRASTYFIGMYAGYVYYKLKDNDEFMIKKIYSHLITLVSFLLLFGGMASGAIFYNPYYEYEPYASASYAAFHRPAWGFGTIGLLFVSSYGHATLLRKILSWRPWIPLSKLVYGAYLMHMSFQIRKAGVTRSSKYFDYFDIYCLGLGDICISFIVALGLYLLVEAPVRKCFRELLMPTSGRRRSTVTPQNTFRENTIRETTLRENTLRESTVREHRAESSNESRL